jgi:glycosyltransferase involved in cell wall biosynthesis
VSIKISVVIPVYNPGVDLERCTDSLLSQTLPASELELIFVDDGSTDDTLQRLRMIESRHEHVRVISIPNSGWPGKPRNVGTDAAIGEYVMYVDQDDRLDPESLERMYVLGSGNGADIVLGKVTSDFRGVHHYLYREQRPRCTVYDSRLINSQTPHKMLRREFLIEHRIRYPEGQRRLEDQLFITRAYFAARSCSVVSDYVCYRYLKRTDGSNAGEQRIDPPSYYENLRDVLDVIDAHTEPGPVRDRFYRRFLRVEMLGKLSGRKVIKTRLERGDIWLVPIRQLAEERFPTSVDDGLPTTARLRAHLMRHGTFADVKDLTARTRRLQPDVRVTAHRGAAGTIRLRVTGIMVDDGLPLGLEPDGVGDWLLPESITGSQTETRLRRVDDDGQMVADVVVISRQDGDEWFVDNPLTISVEAQDHEGLLSIKGEVTLDPATAAGGRPLSDGRHDLSVRVDALGLYRLKPLRVEKSTTGRSTTLGVLGVNPRTLLEVNRSGRVTLAVGVSAQRLRQRIVPATAAWGRGRLVVHLGAGWFASSVLTAELRTARGRAVRLRLSADDERATSWRSLSSALSPGTYRARLLLPRAGAVDLDEPVVVPWSPAAVLRLAAHRGVNILRGLMRRPRMTSRAGPMRDDQKAAADEGGR